MNSGLRGSYFASVNSILKDGMITPELSTRKLNESSMIANSGVVVAMVFAGLIFTAIVAFLICKYYEDINKCMKKSTKMKKKRDARDYKATEVIVKKFENLEATVIGGGDSATASVVTAPPKEDTVASVPAERQFELNDSYDFSGSSWTTLGNGAIVEIDPEFRQCTNSHTPRSPRWEVKVVPVDQPLGD